MPENDAPISKSQAIRDYLAQHPDASPTSTAEALTAQGIPVAPAFVSAVKDVLESPRQPVPEPEMPPMHLPFGEGKLFYKLYAALCSYANDNPRVWMLSVNGFIMDIRDAPRELQVEAFEKGLIPYIPADRGRNSEEDE